MKKNKKQSSPRLLAEVLDEGATVETVDTVTVIQTRWTVVVTRGWRSAAESTPVVPARIRFPL